MDMQQEYTRIMTEARAAYDRGEIDRRQLHHYATAAYLAVVPDGAAQAPAKKRKRNC